MNPKFFFVHFFIFVISFTVSCMLLAADLGVECTVFDVGQGSGAVILDKQRGKSFIVDCGEGLENKDRVKRFNSYIFGAVTRPVNLAGVILSHSDSDHVKLLTRSIQKDRQKYRDQNSDLTTQMTAYLGSPFGGYCKKDSDGEKVLDALLDVNAKIISLSHIIPPERINEKKVDGFNVRPYFLNARIPEFSDSIRNLSLTIVAANAMHRGPEIFLLNGDLAGASNPDTILNGGTNNNGAIVKLTYKRKSILFPGDIDGDGTDRLIDFSFQQPSILSSEQAKDFLKADVLLVAHHGAEANGTNNLKFLLKINPDYAVISAGEYASHVHPRFEVFFNLSNILRFKSLVPHHFVQCGTRSDYFLRYSDRINDIFSLESGSSIIEIPSGDNCVWNRMKTSLPIYTTITNGDIVISISANGVITVTPSKK